MSLMWLTIKRNRNRTTDSFLTRRPSSVKGGLVTRRNTEFSQTDRPNEFHFPLCHSVFPVVKSDACQGQQSS